MKKLKRNFKIRVYLMLILIVTAFWGWAIESYLLGIGSVGLFIANFIWWGIDDKKYVNISKSIKNRLRYRILHDEFNNVTFSTKQKYHEEDLHDLQNEFNKKIDFDATAMDNFISGELDDIKFKYYEELMIFNGNKFHYFAVLNFIYNNENNDQIIKNDPRLSNFADLTFIVINDNSIKFYIENNMCILNAIMEDKIEIYINKLKGLIRQLALIVDEL